MKFNIFKKSSYFWSGKEDVVDEEGRAGPQPDILLSVVRRDADVRQNVEGGQRSML